jgi:hypothetical protein
MMNILEKEDLIKGLPDNVLQQQMQAPTGELPQYLLISEIQRRTDMRKSLQEQPKQESVSEQIMMEGIMANRPPMQPQMPPQMPQQMPPQMPQMPMEQPPMGMAQGGVVRMANGGEVERIRQVINDLIAQGAPQDRIDDLIQQLRLYGERNIAGRDQEIAGEYANIGRDLYGVQDEPVVSRDYPETNVSQEIADLTRISQLEDQDMGRARMQSGIDTMEVEASTQDDPRYRQAQGISFLETPQLYLQDKAREGITGLIDYFSPEGEVDEVDQESMALRDVLARMNPYVSGRTIQESIVGGLEDINPEMLTQGQVEDRARENKRLLKSLQMTSLGAVEDALMPIGGIEGAALAAEQAGEFADSYTKDYRKRLAERFAPIPEFIEKDQYGAALGQFIRGGYGTVADTIGSVRETGMDLGSAAYDIAQPQAQDLAEQVVFGTQDPEAIDAATVGDVLPSWMTKYLPIDAQADFGDTVGEIGGTITGTASNLYDRAKGLLPFTGGVNVTGGDVATQSESDANLIEETTAVQENNNQITSDQPAPDDVVDPRITDDDGLTTYTTGSLGDYEQRLKGILDEKRRGGSEAMVAAGLAISEGKNIGQALGAASQAASQARDTQVERQLKAFSALSKNRQQNALLNLKNKVESGRATRGEISLLVALLRTGTDPTYAEEMARKYLPKMAGTSGKENMSIVGTRPG